MTQRIPVVENILNANDQLAQENHTRLENAGVFSINLMASPGAGKTSLIEQTLPRLKDKLHIAAIDGDIATSLDADRASAAGAQAAIQINTGGNCHLDAVMLLIFESSDVITKAEKPYTNFNLEVTTDEHEIVLTGLPNPSHHNANSIIYLKL